jgi:uncharacterized protein YecE (DUF72 family)
MCVLASGQTEEYARGVTEDIAHGIRIGVGGWVYAPWRGTFYPAGWAQSRELEYASRKLTSVEVNGTYYGSQRPETFAKWHDEVPDDFVFALKGPRFVTNRRVLAEAAPAVERFFESGVMALKGKLGPINWQFMPTKKFDATDFEQFLKLLPHHVEGRTIRHAVEVRHESFRTPEFVSMARCYGVAVVLAGDSEYPVIPDPTASFAYLRIMGTREGHQHGYGSKALSQWADRARQLARGEVPADVPAIGAPAARENRDVFLYVISGFKARNPDAALALISRIAKP